MGSGTTAEQRWLDQIRSIATEFLAPWPVDLYFFGSRASGTHWHSSDVDLGVDHRGNLPPGVLPRLREAFEESTIPYDVDVVDLREVGERFRERVLREGVRWTVSKSA